MRDTHRPRLPFYIFLSAFLSVFSLAFSDARGICPLERCPFQSVKYTENRLFFFTQPRSGMHWTLYILKHFTKRPFTDGDSLCYNPFGQREDGNLPFIIQDHDAYRFLSKCQDNCFSLSSPNPEKDKILILVRNPLDIVLRESSSFQHAVENVRKDLELPLFINLHYLEIWPKANQHVIYYEDLLDKPKEEIEKLLQFVEVPFIKIDDFIMNLDLHKCNTITYYEKYHGMSQTKGEDRKLYQKQYSAEQLKALVYLLKQIDPIIWEKYLKRYEI